MRRGLAEGIKRSVFACWEMSVFCRWLGWADTAPIKIEAANPRQGGRQELVPAPQYQWGFPERILRSRGEVVEVRAHRSERSDRHKFCEGSGYRLLTDHKCTYRRSASLFRCRRSIRATDDGLSPSAPARICDRNTHSRPCR